MTSNSPQRLGLNIGGYHGRTIDIHQVLRDGVQAAVNKNWTVDRLPVVSCDGSPLLDFIAFRRGLPSAARRIYLSTGIHGDEPAGPLAALRLLQEDAWPADAALWLCPCLNPGGFTFNRRENPRGADLNRDFRHLASEETRAHVRWLEAQPSFDLCLCLHEDWEARGFYLYELNPDGRPSLAGAITQAAAEACPIDLSPEIEGWPASQGVIRPGINPADRPQWPEALYLVTHKTRQSYTMEAPSDFPLETRVDALVAAVRAALAPI